MPLTVSFTHRLFKGDLAVIFYISLLKLAIHLIVNLCGGYGLFRDELYYMACTDHLAAGYVDQPPFSIYVLKLITIIAGDSLFAIRLIPAITGSITVFLTGLIAIRLGARKPAQFLACIGAASPIHFAMHTFYSMNAIDFLLWTLTGYLVLLIIQTANKKYWIALGVVLGVGLLNKIGVLFLGIGIFAGLLFTEKRNWLVTPWPYAAGGIAFLIFSPYIIWNLQHEWAHLEFIHNASAGKYAHLSPLDFIAGQVLLNNPVAMLVWVPGLIALFFFRPFKPYRLLGFLYLGPFLIFLLNGTSKPEYLAPAYGVVWAAGGVWFERFMMRFRLGSLITVGTYACITIVAMMLLPMVLPILPVERYIRYADSLGFKPSSAEAKKVAALPQFYADMFGWKEKARDVAAVYNSLTEEDKARCAIFSTNYGRCGAIDYYGDAMGLPKSIGNHNNYWLWGPQRYTGEVMIILGGQYEDHYNDFEEVKQVAVSDCQYCMPYEDNLNIFLCRKSKMPLQAMWPEEKHYE